jgi:cytochrome c oxidase subunit III
MQVVSEQQRKKIHPHKFTLWVAIGSILMMFAGLTSAYIVKRAQANWALLEIPKAFWVSTVVIVLSSLTIYLAEKAFKERQMLRYRQIVGFYTLTRQDIKLYGAGSNASFSFLLAIASLHGLHILGGVIALFVMYMRSKNVKIRSYNPVPIEVASTYWHFVDLLWIYLIVFFSLMK